MILYYSFFLILILRFYYFKCTKFKIQNIKIQIIKLKGFKKIFFNLNIELNIHKDDTFFIKIIYFIL
jgi:hypothetical protein